MTPTPTLDPQRTDQLRTFLVVEAAASAPARRPVLTPARRRVLAGATAVLVLGGAFVAAEAVGGPAPAAIAVEVDGEWTTVRIVDIDADPDAVVAQLREAGFAAERRSLPVVRTDDGGMEVTHEGGAGAGVVGFVHSGEGGGAYGLVGLSVTLPPDLTPAGPPEIGTEEVPVQATEDGIAVVEDDLLDAGVRFEPGGGVSLRRGADVTILVHTER